MRLSSTVEEKAERERRERRMQYASSLPALKVPQHLTKRAETTVAPHLEHPLKRAEMKIAYLDPIEPPDRRFKERIYENELESMRLTEAQVARRADQASIRAAWLKDQLDQRKQEERELERRIEQEKMKWVKRRELEAEIERLREQLKEAWAAIKNGHTLEQEREAQRLKEEEAAKKKQVRHLAKVCVQKLQKRGLTRAWNALCEHAEQRKVRLRRMNAIAQRLIRPKQTAAFAHWRGSWMHQQSRAKVKDTASALAEEMERRRQLEEEVDRLKATIEEGAAAKTNPLEQELKAMQRQKTASDAEREKQLAYMQQRAARRLLQADLARGFTAWRDE